MWSLVGVLWKTKTGKAVMGLGLLFMAGKFLWGEWEDTQKENEGLRLAAVMQHNAREKEIESHQKSKQVIQERDDQYHDDLYEFERELNQAKENYSHLLNQYAESSDRYANASKKLAKHDLEHLATERPDSITRVFNDGAAKLRSEREAKFEAFRARKTTGDDKANRSTGGEGHPASTPRPNPPDNETDPVEGIFPEE